MSDVVIRIIREELRNSGLIQIPRSKLQDISSVLMKMLWKIHITSEESKLIVSRILNNMEQDIEILARTRLLKLILKNELAQGSFDEKISILLMNIIKAERDLMSPLVVKYHDKVLYFFKKTCIVNSKIYRAYDMALLDLEDLVFAEINNCGETLRHPFLKYYRPK